MGTYVLIVAMWAGTFAKGDSVAISSVPGFASIASCEAAGKAAIATFETTFKTVKYICVKPA